LFISGIHGLVNNAGVVGQNAWDDWMTPDSYLSCWEVNTLGLIRMTHAFKPLLKKAKFVLFGN
jgi:NAD(P)-dependent dehydrogenase (short-subunit alcohol dehydrogenase family)